ncbi:MAG: Hsp20 family protein, partial [Thioalkalispiraceae bacterium]
NTVGFDRLASMLDNAFRTEHGNSSYPPYDIEALDENRYAITLAVAGFNQDEIDIEVEGDVLTVKGNKAEDKSERHFLYQGIASRAFERKFNLADYVEVTGARLNNGLLTIELKHELPESMKPRRIEIHSDTSKLIEHESDAEKAA